MNLFQERRGLTHLTPVMIFILDQIHRLDNVGMVQGRGDAEFRRELLHVVPFAFILATLTKLLLRHPLYQQTKANRKLQPHLYGIKLLRGLVPFMSQSDDSRCAFADSDLFACAILLQEGSAGSSRLLAAAFVMRVRVAILRASVALAIVGFLRSDG
jgi:hypothetical protein